MAAGASTRLGGVLLTVVTVMGPSSGGRLGDGSARAYVTGAVTINTYVENAGRGQAENVEGREGN